MTKSATGRALVLLCVVVFAIAIGCGGDKDAPVYDTVANPYGLPIQACDLLDAIEAGRLVSYDVITEAFGRLYLENQELLENKHWKELVGKLGIKFKHRADSLIQNGLSSYTQAAGFYMLASFSNPDDAELMEKAALFTTWKEMMEKIDYDYIPLPTSPEFTDRLDFLRCFVFGDSLERKFAEEYLVHQLLDSILAVPGMAHPGSLSRTDAALLTYLGVLDGETTGVAPSKAHLQYVDFFARRLVAVGPAQVRVELYFTSYEEISDSTAISVSVEPVTMNPTLPAEEDLQYIEIYPIQLCEMWSRNQVRIAGAMIPFDDTAAWFRANLFGKKSVTTTGPLPIERFSRR